MSNPIWYCTRQRAGPLVKECRALRPRLSPTDDLYTRSQKNKILRPPSDSSVCRNRVDRLELRLALFGFEGTCYTLTFEDDFLPGRFPDVKKRWRAFLARLKRMKGGEPFDYIYLTEGRHGDHRYHVHAVLRYRDFPPAVIEHLWKYGSVESEPLLRGQRDSFRRMAKYYNKEASDGIIIPVGSRPWVCSQSLVKKLPPPERWMDSSGAIEIPDKVMLSGRSSVDNEFGAYHYGWYIRQKTGLLF